MTSPALLTAFVRRLEALDDAAWQRIGANVPHLGDASAAALFARGDTIARGLPDALPYFVRALAGMAHALHAEFPATPSGIPTPAQIASSRLTPEQQASAVTAAALATLLDVRRAAFPGAVACIEAVLPALVAPRFYSPAQVVALYAPLEEEIPFVTLQPSSDAH